MKFKVFQGKPSKDGRHGQFYFHVCSTNGKITLASEGYPTLAHARRAVAQVWMSFAKALLPPTYWRSIPPVPYTRDSLMPRRA